MSDLTVYDTGEMLEPILHPGTTGLVDFDNEEGGTVLSLATHPGSLRVDGDDVTVIEIDWSGPGLLRVKLNGRGVVTLNEFGQRVDSDTKLWSRINRHLDSGEAGL